MHIDTNGSVGIGKTNPSAKLDVAGDILTEGGNPQFGTSSSAFTIMTLHSKTASGVANNPYIAWQRDSTRQAYMGWGTPGTVFYVTMENNNQLYFQIPNGAVFSSDDVRKPSGGTFVASSDARLKDVKGSYTKGLTDIEKLTPVRYNYKAGNPRNEPSDKEFVGLIAQDVLKIFPDAVKEDRDGYLSLDPSQFTYTLINAVKELKAANDNLNVDSARLRSENEELRDALDDLRVRVKRLEYGK